MAVKFNYSCKINASYKPNAEQRTRKMMYSLPPFTYDLKTSKRKLFYLKSDEIIF